MGDHVTLMGAEDVRSAGYRMAEAARDMNTAASSIDYALARHQQFLDEWLGRLADILATAFPATPPETPGDPQAKGQTDGT